MLREYLKSIADKLREKLGINDSINAQSFTDKIDKVYDAGKKAEYDRFWDNYQNGDGVMSVYDYAFAGSGWNDEVFKPKYTIKPTSTANNMFRNSKITDLSKATFDFSATTYVSSMFYDTDIVNVPELNFSKVSTATAAMGSVFYYCYALETVEKIILSTNGAQQFSNMFRSCNKLKEIRFEGVIGRTISFSYSSLLSVESMKSIISCLKNYKGTTSEGSYTLTFSSTSWTNLEASGTPCDDGLTDDETKIWQDYVTDVLGWNV